MDQMGRALSRRDLLRRGLALGLGVPVIAGLLAACGDDDDDDGADEAEPTATEAVAEETPTEPEAGETPEATEAAGDATEAEDEASPTEGESDATEPDAGATGTEEEADTPSGEAADLRLALDWFPWAQHSGLYLAQERGYFEDENLNVTIEVPANPEDGLRLAGSGEVAFAISYQADTLLARGQDIPVVSVAALVQHPLNSIMSLTSAGIERPADLQGKSVGYAGLPSDEALMKSVLESDGLTLDDIEMVNVGFSLAPALVSGQVDAVIGAYAVYETFQIEQQGEEVSVLLLTDWGVPDYYELVLVSGEELPASDPDVIQRFINALVRGYDEAIADPQAAIDALLDNNPDAVREVEEASIDQLATYWTSDGAVPFGTQTAENWQRYADWLKENDLLDTAVDPATAFTNEFVEAAAG
jgi:putative hydroxymethylpyrimidine transport system substrate-binding protein